MIFCMNKEITEVMYGKYTEISKTNQKTRMASKRSNVGSVPCAKHCSSKISAGDRAKEDFYEETGLLFCCYYHSIDHTRKDTINDHIQSKKHKSRKEAAKDCPSGSATRQTMKTGCHSRTESTKTFTLDFVKCLVFANIPLEKAAEFRWFLEKYTHQGGTVPQPSTLQHEYLPSLYSDHQASLKIMR